MNLQDTIDTSIYRIRWMHRSIGYDRYMNRKNTVDKSIEYDRFGFGFRVSGSEFRTYPLRRRLRQAEEDAWARDRQVLRADWNYCFGSRS